MGRLADARKRAKKKSGEPGTNAPATSAPGPDVPGPDAPETDARETDVPVATEARPVADPKATPAASVETAAPEPDAVFADEPPPVAAPARPQDAPAARGRIELPASGLAEDILARADVSALAPGPAPIDAPRPGPGEAAGAVAPESPAGGAGARAHNISFFAAPAREDRVVAEATEHLATFFLDREEYGVDVRLVQEIRRLSEITQVPRAPAFIKGVINLRGRIIPVVDLKLRLGLGEVQPTRTTRIVVVKLGERLVGLTVDGASQVLKVPVSGIEPPPEEVVDKGGTYIRGVAKLADRLIILIDLHRILDLDGRGEAGARA